MYFDPVLFYLATLINDISLMNFSNPLAVLLISLRYPISLILVCFVQIQFQSSALQSSFLFPEQLRRSGSPCLGLQR